MLEIWADHPDFVGFYQVSTLGRVRSLKRTTTPGKVLSPNVHKTGRRYVTLSKNGVETREAVARLVARTFLGPPTGPVVRHKNDVCWDDVPENLQYGTDSENKYDAVLNGKHALGERNGRSKLTREQVVLIRQMLHAGVTRTAIAPKFGVSRTAIGRIGAGHAWKWLAG